MDNCLRFADIVTNGDFFEFDGLGGAHPSILSNLFDILSVRTSCRYLMPFTSAKRLYTEGINYNYDVKLTDVIVNSIIDVK